MLSMSTAAGQHNDRVTTNSATAGFAIEFNFVGTKKHEQQRTLAGVVPKDLLLKMMLARPRVREDHRIVIQL